MKLNLLGKVFFAVSAAAAAGKVMGLENGQFSEGSAGAGLNDIKGAMMLELLKKVQSRG